jgi:hypothetical protein
MCPVLGSLVPRHPAHPASSPDWLLSVLASKIQTWSHLASASRARRDCPKSSKGAGNHYIFLGGRDLEKGPWVSYLPFGRRFRCGCRYRCGGPYSFPGPSALCRGCALKFTFTLARARRYCPGSFRWRKRITPRGGKQPRLPVKNLDSSRYGGGITCRLRSRPRRPHEVSASNKVLASFRSSVSKPSVNQP